MTCTLCGQPLYRLGSLWLHAGDLPVILPAIAPAPPIAA